MYPFDGRMVFLREEVCREQIVFISPVRMICSWTVKIGGRVWIATDVFVALGVTIGRGALIGARSSVFSDMPEGMICLGSPAKPMKPRVMK